MSSDEHEGLVFYVDNGGAAQADAQQALTAIAQVSVGQRLCVCVCVCDICMYDAIYASHKFLDGYGILCESLCESHVQQVWLTSVRVFACVRACVRVWVHMYVCMKPNADRRLFDGSAEHVGPHMQQVVKLVAYMCLAAMQPCLYIASQFMA